MTLTFVQLLAGGVLLYLGAEWLIGGASGLARRLGVTPLVIGLTVVAYGTSAPEGVVSSAAALEGSAALAIGNVVGSNIVNIGLILGLSALLAPPRIDGSLALREIPVFVGSALVPPVLLVDGQLGRLDGCILVAVALLFTVWTLRAARRPDGHSSAPPAESIARRGTAVLVVSSLAGLAGLVAGGKLFVAGATELARVAGISERVIGLTIVAVGTSLPELAASLLAAWRGHSAIAVGNVVGSNIFNSFLILGVAALVRPLRLSLVEMRSDFFLMIGVTFVAAVMMRGDRVLSRVEGGLLLGCYAGFLAFVSAG